MISFDTPHFDRKTFRLYLPSDYNFIWEMVAPNERMPLPPLPHMKNRKLLFAETNNHTLANETYYDDRFKKEMTVIHEFYHDGNKPKKYSLTRMYENANSYHQISQIIDENGKYNFDSYKHTPYQVKIHSFEASPQNRKIPKGIRGKIYKIAYNICNNPKTGAERKALRGILAFILKHIRK